MTRIGGRVFCGPPLADLFPVGRMCMTPSVSYLLGDDTLANVMAMHAAGQWCEPKDLLTEGDQEANEYVLADRKEGGPVREILSKYKVTSRDASQVVVFVITMLDGEQTHTTICLPNER